MNESISDRELVINRLLDAPRNLVFKVWTDPDHIVKWWGPNGFTNTNHGMDVSENGVWRFTMHGTDGVDYKNKIVFLEVVEPERLVYRHSDDEHPERVHFHVTVTFKAIGNKTDLTMHMVFDTKEELEKLARENGAIEGAHQHITRLEAYLGGPEAKAPMPQPLVITREFDAPRDLVFSAFSEAKHLAHWWGPAGMKLFVRKLEFRPGGIFHYSMTADNGYTMWGKFTYHDIIPKEKIVFVNTFSDEDGLIVRPPFPDPWPIEIYYVVTLTEMNGKTKLILKGYPIHANEEQRQTFFNNFDSMYEGFGGTFDALKEYLVKGEKIRDKE